MLRLGEQNIKGLRLGDQKIKKAYLGESLVFSEAKPSRLPEGYTELQYIENPNLAYIQMNSYLATTISKSWEIIFEIIDSTINAYLIGSNTNYLYYNRNTKRIIFYNKTTYGGGQNSFDISSMLLEKFVFSYDRPTNTVTLNGDSKTGYQYSSSGINSLFAKNGANASNFRLFNFKTLDYKFVPAIRENDRKVGLFNLTSYESTGDIYFLISANANNFSAGLPV